MNIGTVSARSGVPAKAIRYYEQIGLIRSAARTANGYRTYDDGDLSILLFIRAARSLGISVPEIADLLSIWRNGGCPSTRQRVFLQQQVDAMSQKIETLRSLRKAFVCLAERRLGDRLPRYPIIEGLTMPEAE